MNPFILFALSLAANWSTYNGDYSGRRYSALTEIKGREERQQTVGSR